MSKVSIAIRSKNDVKCLERTIKSILRQNFKDFEICVFDNGSTDSTLEFLKQYPQIKIFNIPEGNYIPGAVLNMAVKQCGDSEVIVFNNSDSVPCGSNWLAHITKPLFEGTAQACYARQISRPDADVWVRKDYENTFGQKEFSKDFFSMVSSAALTKVLKENPFDENMKYSEDVLWARQLRKKGINVAYVPDAIVEHSHNYTFSETKKRFSGEGYADAIILKNAQSLESYLKGLIGAVFRDAVYLLKCGEISKFFKCLRWRFIQKTSYYLARRKAFKSL